MSGELILENKSWARTALALAGTCVPAVGLTVLLLSYVPLEGLPLLVCAALLVYVLFRVFYPAVSRLLPRGQEQPRTWTVTPDTLLLGETAVPRDTIKMVHCWPNRDALGHAGAGWVVNIETTGKNHLLRSLSEGEAADRSVRQLRALVIALGYGAQWREE